MNEAKIREAIHLIWRNLPSGVTTFGQCFRNCGRGPGRGGGPCLLCARDDLAEHIGLDNAKKYVSAVLKLRELEREMLEGKPESCTPRGLPGSAKVG